MKKLVSLMLVLMMVMMAAGSFAEAAQMSPFVEIAKGVTAKVYQAPGGAETDSLQAGTLCGLIETVEADGAEWFNVLYLNSEKKAATGYIKAADAKVLSTDELQAKMNDPATANAVLDLIDALNDYIKSVAQVADTSNTTGNTQNENLIKQLYGEAIAMLDQIVNVDLSDGLNQIATIGSDLAGNLLSEGKAISEKIQQIGGDILTSATETGTELWNNAVETGTELWKSAEKTGTELVQTATENGTELWNNAVETGTELVKSAEKTGAELLQSAEKTGTELVSDLNKLIDNGSKIIQENGGDVLKQLETNLGFKTEDVSNQIANITEKVKDALNNGTGDLLKNGVDAVDKLLKSEGFTEGLKNVVSMLQGLIPAK